MVTATKKRDPFLCTSCGERPIYIKKRGLCKKCYQQWWIRNLHVKPLSGLQGTLSNLVEKYGDEILQDFELLKRKPYWSLTLLGKKHGFTRERARQIFNIINETPYAYYQKQKIKDREKDIGCPNDPRRKNAEYKKDSPVGKGAKAELLAWKECEKRGFSIQLSCKKTFDFIVNEKTVDVKSCLSPFRPKKKNNWSTYYHFNLGKPLRAKPDFYICYSFPAKTFYIVPVSATSGLSIYIRTTATHKRPEYNYSPHNNWKKYKEAWHLLNDYKSP